MVKDAFYFIGPLALLAAVCIYLGWIPIAVVLLLLVVFVAWFFRNPHRAIPDDPSLIVSPADGKIIRLDESGNETRISIFLSVFDVHVNRSPLDGSVISSDYRPGKFHAAWDDSASVENERLLLTIGTEHRQLTFALVAGLVARRIIPWVAVGDSIAKGARIGLIRFGSRVDISLPSNCDVIVRRGDRVRGGASVLARWREAVEDET